MTQLLFNIFFSTTIYFLISVSFYLFFSTVRFFNLAHGAIYMIGAYSAYCVKLLMNINDGKLINNQDMIWIYIVSMIVSMLTGGIFGIVINQCVYKPLRKRKASNLILLLASFGVLIFMQNGISIIFGNQMLSSKIGPVKEGYHVFGFIITSTQLLIIIIAFILIILLMLFTQSTKTGKAMKAVADNSIVSSLIGINKEKIILFALMLASGLAGLTGYLVSLETSFEPTMGFHILLKSIIVVIIGGIKSIKGILAGSLLLGLIENSVVWFLPAGWKDAIVFGVFLLFLLFKPYGIFGQKEE